MRTGPRLALPLVGSAFLLACPATAQAAPRNPVQVAAVEAPPSELPFPPLRLSSSLAAIGGRAPTPADDAAPVLRRSHALTLLAQAPVAAPSRSVTDAAKKEFVVGPAPADPDDDEEGSDAPTGPPVVLGDMPGRQAPPLPAGRSVPVPGREPPLVPGIPGVPGVPCIPGLPCVPVRPAAGVPSGTAPSRPQEETSGVGDIGEAADALLGGIGWGTAPIRWGGELGVQTRRQWTEGGAGSWSRMGLFNIRASSYIYQPWFAQVSGSLGLAYGNESSGASSGGQSTSTDNNSVTGSGTLQLFPQSRFPFMAMFDRSDSRTNGTFVGNDYTNTRFGMRQAYRTESGAQNATVGYERSSVESSSQGSQNAGTDIVNAVYGDYSHAFVNQTTQMSGRYSESERSATGENSKLMNYYARHTYRFDDNLNAETSTMFNDNRIRYRSLGAGGGFTDSHGRYLQMGSSVSWRPETEYEDEISPLSVIAGVNMSTASSEFNTESSDSRTVSGNISATYAYDKNLTLMGSGLASRLDNSTGQSQTLTNLGGAANYTGDPLTFGKFSYNWNAGTSAARQGGGVNGDNVLYGALGSHSLNRDFPLSQEQSVMLTMSQSVSHNSDQLVGSSTSLTHTAGATWRVVGGDQSFGSLGLNFSDMNTTGANEGHYRYLYLQLNGNGQLSPRSSLNANLTVQWSMQDTQQQVATTNGSGTVVGTTFVQQTQNTNVFGSVNYNHMRAFGVQGLRYNLSFNANTQMIDSRLRGDASAQPDNYQYWLENRFDYNIGMLTLSATGTVIETGGKKNAQVFFRATRQFGRF